MMTSNLGSDVIQEHTSIGDYEALKKQFMDVIGKYFRPEFLNRLDEAIVFHALSEDMIGKIATIQLNRLNDRLAERDIKLDVSKPALEEIAKVGYDPVFGARPLKGAIQHYIEYPLAQDLLAGKFIDSQTIKVGYREGKFAFDKA